MPPIQLVCFDLGGVLIRICRSWEEGCRAAGLALRGSSTPDPSGANGAHEISRLHQTGKIDCESFLRHVAQSRDGLYSIDEVRRIHESWILGEYPRVSDVIDRIHDSGLSTAALSNTNGSHWRQMQDFPALTGLRHRLASHELGLAKPDAAIYREAERRIGVKGANILFFDDLLENVQAAIAVGWQAVQIDHTGDTATQIECALRVRGVAV